MDTNRILSEGEVEALIAGRRGIDAALDDLAAFFATARTEALRAPSAEVENAHLAAIAEAVRLGSSAPQERAGGSIRRKSMLSTLFASLWVKVAAAAASAIVATGSLAAANALPGPAQDAVASVADHIGINLPSSDDDQGEVSDTQDSQDNQGDSANEDNGKSVSDDVHGVLGDDSLEGRDKGDAVSDAASQNRQDGDHSQVGDEHKSGDHGSDDAVENDGSDSSDDSSDGTVEDGSGDGSHETPEPSDAPDGSGDSQPEDAPAGN